MASENANMGGQIMLPIPEILIDMLCRFWLYVDKKSDSECWNWIGTVSGNGYGHMRINSKMYRANRISYYIHFKKDPGELLVCHSCNNKLCINPHHLFLGTVSENRQHAFDTGIIKHKGTLNPQAKFLSSHIREIRELQYTMTQVEIARLFNVTPSTINKILTGKTWTHVKDKN